MPQPPPPYTIVYTKVVEKQLRRLPGQLLGAVIRKIASLAENPRQPGVKRLQGNRELYRVRQGDYRIIYEIHDESVTVMVVKVGHRRDVYDK